MYKRLYNEVINIWELEKSFLECSVHLNIIKNCISFIGLEVGNSKQLCIIFSSKINVFTKMKRIYNNIFLPDNLEVRWVEVNTCSLLVASQPIRFQDYDHVTPGTNQSLGQGRSKSETGKMGRCEDRTFPPNHPPPF